MDERDEEARAESGTEHHGQELDEALEAVVEQAAVDRRGGVSGEEDRQRLDEGLGAAVPQADREDDCAAHRVEHED